MTADDEYCPGCGRKIIEQPPPGTPEQIVALNKHVAVPISELQRFVSGYPPDPSRWVYLKPVPPWIAETDRLACKRLNVDCETGLAAMDKLWGHPLSAERERLGGGANAQKRGIITRRLEKQLREELIDAR